MTTRTGLNLSKTCLSQSTIHKLNDLTLGNVNTIHPKCTNIILRREQDHQPMTCSDSWYDTIAKCCQRIQAQICIATSASFEHQRYSYGSDTITSVHSSSRGPDNHEPTVGFTYVVVIPRLAAKTRALRASNVSWANCGSSFTSILYRETSMAMTAIHSVSAKLRRWKSVSCPTESSGQ